MDAAPFYRAVDPQFCQGDILERVPHLYLKDQPRPPRKTTLAKNRVVYDLEELGEGALPSTPEEGVWVPATCQVTRAMLLTHGCEIDKDLRNALSILHRHSHPRKRREPGNEFTLTSVISFPGSLLAPGPLSNRTAWQRCFAK